MDRRLMPCPFCGEQNDLGVEPYPGNYGFYVVCSAYSGDGLQHQGCGCRSGYGETMIQAIEKWNRRAERPNA